MNPPGWRLWEAVKMSTDITSQVSSSVTALESEFNAIAQNLANVSTVGYKRLVSSFARTLAEQQDLFSEDDSGPVDVNLGVDFSQGLSLIETGRTLDLALGGKGFFVVETTDGPVYTRSGMFRVNQNGQIVDSDGRIISGQGGPITVGQDVALSQLYVGNDGTVKAGDSTLGRFRIVEFGDNEKELIPVGDNCFKAPENISPAQADDVSVRQGYLESSNVKIIDELVNMIMVSRLYEANMKFITARKEASSGLMSVAMG